MKFLLLFCFFIASAFAKVEIEVTPRKPLINETFQISFRVETESDQEPDISFDPQGLEILGRNTQGVSTRTVYMNGQLSVTREIVIVYEGIAAQKGPVYLKNIVVVVDGKREMKPDATIVVVDEPQEVSTVFIAAEVEPKTVYVGQGLTARYHVYDKNNLRAFDIKKYPKLHKFMKRFIQENEQPQRVSVDNQVFKRQIIYSSRLFPEKPGKLSIDPMEVAVSFSSDFYNPFGFGFGRSDLKTKTIQSDPIEIEVKDLPAPPADFSGLVGEFTFTLKADEANVLVNEPLEWKLTVVGDGALENFGAPDLLPFNEVEKFNDHSELKIMNADTAQKDINYTYLAKSPGLIPARVMTLSTFSPKLGKYVTHEIKIPQIKIGGSAEVLKPDSPDKKSSPLSSESKPLMPQMSLPSFSASWIYEPVLWLGLLSFLTVLSFLLHYKSHFVWSFKRDNLVKKLESGEGSYGDWLKYLHEKLPLPNLDLNERIRQSGLSDASKNELYKVLETFEKSEFSPSKEKVQSRMSRELKIEMKHLKEKTQKHAQDEFAF
jgi:hypothetical protein